MLVSYMAIYSEERRKKWSKKICAYLFLANCGYDIYIFIYVTIETTMVF